MTNNDAKFLSAMREAVAANPSYVYPQSQIVSPSGGVGDCTYLVWERSDRFGNNAKPTDQPSCIVGHGILNSGLSNMDFLRQVEGERAGALNLPLSNEAKMFSDEIQSSQDSGNTWGNAWNEACEKFPELNLEPV